VSTTKREIQTISQKQSVVDPLTLRELAAVLVKHYDLHEGKFDLTIEFQIGVGAVGPKENLAPGVAAGVSKVGLTRATSDGPMTVDAATINPTAAPRQRTRRTSRNDTST
jgi:hypothetical protein